MNFRTSLKYVAGLTVGAVIFIVSYEHNQVYELANFRRSDGEFQRGLMAELPSKEGLAQLNMSGSARPTKEGLRYALSSIHMPVYVFDIFSKKHYYINGLPEDWFDYKRSEKIGFERKKVTWRGLIHRLVYTGKLQHDNQDIQSEQQMVEELGFNYILVDQMRKSLPKPEHVDSFLRMVESLPDPVWVHFHCSAGKGRTTIAMVMYDILKNGKKVSLEDIINRHYLLGSENLFDTTVWHNGRYSKEMLEARKQFVISFYEYVNAPDGYGVRPWSEWVEVRAAT